ncbi:MAG: thymidylate synthase [Candidatus Bipolaricaulaceae bacterium]
MGREVPLLTATGRTIAEAWEKSVVTLWQRGAEVATEYDRPGDPPSRDCTMVIQVAEPLSEPRIHRSFPAQLRDLEVYRREVVEGIHDHRVRDGGWSYSYHQRLFDYDGTMEQMEAVLTKLAQHPHTRRAQAITWLPERDLESDEPPCLQRLWLRLLPTGAGYRLMMNAHWRSRDALKAAFMNMYALTELQRHLAGRLAQMTGHLVQVGQYLDISDSYHIYGADFPDMERFLRSLARRSFQERTWTTAEARRLCRTEGEEAT